ncbi:hypothetical protein [Marinilactibacillus sp. Marseille-P9653]|uniref:hypothetical protein n=1 Tax=Marinilactibacillus sp. Marseille-P9653 TaxID=2866583 RepID=UPI001CE3E8D3|nr:hypothetical protein [Marinilactibacillus sp. Marseille-P9653]
MADIKSMNIFGSQNKGLDQIRKASIDKGNKKSINPTVTKEKKKNINNKKLKPRKVNKRGAGAPVRNFDRVFSASQPIKLSAILNATSRILSETHMSEYSRDEILRAALDDYIKVNLTKEDKKALLNEVTKDLNTYRLKNPTLDKLDEDGNILENAKEIEEETERVIAKKWGI